jgi:hypothetical protein
MSVDAAPRVGVRRPLSPLERWYWIADQVSPLNVIARVRLDGDVSPDVLRRALDALQQRHPLLRVAIDAGAADDFPRFVPCSAPIPLRQVRITGSAAVAEDRWLREVDERELVDRVDWRTGPLCRTVVLTRRATGRREGFSELILTLPHCIADGTTVLSLVRDWVTIAALLDAGHPPGAGEPVLPPSEELFPGRYRGRGGAWRLRATMLRDRLTMRLRRPLRVEPTAFVPFDRRRTRLLHRSFSGEQVAAMLRACRREGTTVHGLLAAAMVAAVARDRGAAPSRHVTIGSPIDFRGELVPPVPPTAVGTYVATVPSVVEHRAGDTLWPAARAVGRDLARRKRRGEHFAMVNLVGGSCPMSAAQAMPLIEFIDAAGPVNLCISNIGRYEFPSTVGRWRASGAQFMAGLSVVGSFVSTVNTSHGRLFWNFVYVDGAVPEDRARALVATCVNSVLAVTGGPTPHRGAGQ